MGPLEHAALQRGTNSMPMIEMIGAIVGLFPNTLFVRSRVGKRARPSCHSLLEVATAFHSNQRVTDQRVSSLALGVEVFGGEKATPHPRACSRRNGGDCRRDHAPCKNEPNDYPQLAVGGCSSTEFDFMSTNEAAARRSYSSKATVLTAKTSFAAAWSSELQPSTELSFSPGASIRILFSVAAA